MRKHGHHLSEEHKRKISEANKALVASPGEGTEKDSLGHFKKGNKSGGGNPYTKQINRFRAMIYECVEEKDFRELVLAMLREAKAGDKEVRKDLVNRLIGTPTQAVAFKDETERPEGEVWSWGDFAAAMAGVKIPLPEGLKQPNNGGDGEKT